MAAQTKKKAPVQVKYYRVMVDAILGADQPAEGEASPFQFRPIKDEFVTSADLIAAGVDIAWQLKVGALEELGYVPILQPAGDDNANATS